MSQPERTPPHDLKAERSVLGAVLIKPAALDEVADLEVDDFFLPAHREIFECMRAIAKRGQPIDAVTLANDLKISGMTSRFEGGEAYLLVLANATPTAENVLYYAKIVGGKAVLRRLIAACAEVQSAAYGDVYAPDEFLDEAQRKMGEIRLAGSAGPVRVGDVLGDVMQAMEDRGTKPEGFLVPTGLKRMRPLRGGHLIVVAANPGRGKTSWAMNVAVHAAVNEKVPVLIFSLEMETFELIERALAGKARVNGEAVSRGKMEYSEWRRVTEASNQLSASVSGEPVPLYIDDRKLTTSRICAEARRWRARHPGPRALIVIDYLGLVSPDVEEKSREREVAKMSLAFKMLGHKSKADAAVILAVQLNRDNKTKDGKYRTPVMGDLRESGAIEADADMVVLPWWEGKPKATGRHPADLIIAKYRGGHPSNVRVDWEPEYLTFSDPLEDDDPQEELEWVPPTS